MYFFGILLIYICTFKPLHIVFDALEYQNIILNYNGFINSIIENSSFELSFWLILEVNSFLGGTVEGVFFIYSIFSILILFRAIVKFSAIPLLSFFIFVFCQSLFR